MGTNMRAGVCLQVRTPDGRWIGSHRERCVDDTEDAEWVRQYQAEIRQLGEKYRELKRDRFSVIAASCDCCGLPTDSPAHIEHCRG